MAGSPPPGPLTPGAGFHPLPPFGHHPQTPNTPNTPPPIIDKNGPGGS